MTLQKFSHLIYFVEFEVVLPKSYLQPLQI